jgi:hypothetical protein
MVLASGLTKNIYRFNRKRKEKKRKEKKRTQGLKKTF